MPMFWNEKKCIHGHPSKVPTYEQAVELVGKADFEKAVYVNVSEEEGQTKQAFTFVDFGAWTFCIAGHAHMDEAGQFSGGGNAYVPGLANFQTKLSDGVARTIYAQGIRGAWSDVDSKRYPRLIKK